MPLTPWGRGGGFGQLMHDQHDDEPAWAEAWAWPLTSAWAAQRLHFMPTCSMSPAHGLRGALVSVCAHGWLVAAEEERRRRLRELELQLANLEAALEDQVCAATTRWRWAGQGRPAHCMRGAGWQLPCAQVQGSAPHVPCTRAGGTCIILGCGRWSRTAAAGACLHACMMPAPPALLPLAPEALLMPHAHFRLSCTHAT